MDLLVPIGALIECFVTASFVVLLYSFLAKLGFVPQMMMIIPVEEDDIG